MERTEFDEVVPDGGADEECVLCKAVTEPDQGHPVEVNRHMLATKGLVVMPALGPLVPGHALVVTRKHSIGLAYEDQSVRDEYLELAERLRGVCRRRGQD